MSEGASEVTPAKRTRAPPRVVAHGPPRVSAAGRVLRDQHVTGADPEDRAPRVVNSRTPDRVITYCRRGRDVPVELGAGRTLLEPHLPGRLPRRRLIGAGGLQLDLLLGHLRLTVGAG